MSSSGMSYVFRYERTPPRLDGIECEVLKISRAQIKNRCLTIDFAAEQSNRGQPDDEDIIANYLPQIFEYLKVSYSPSIFRTLKPHGIWRGEYREFTPEQKETLETLIQSKLGNTKEFHQHH
jgi:hypothetical protein